MVVSGMMVGAGVAADTLAAGTVVGAGPQALNSAIRPIQSTILRVINSTMNAASGWIGLMQRAALVPFMIWLFGFALGLLRRTAAE